MSLTRRSLIRRWQWLRRVSWWIGCRRTNAALYKDLYQGSVTSSIRDEADSSLTFTQPPLTDIHSHVVHLKWFAHSYHATTACGLIFGNCSHNHSFNSHHSCLHIPSVVQCKSQCYSRFRYPLDLGGSFQCSAWKYSINSTPTAAFMQHMRLCVKYWWNPNCVLVLPPVRIWGECVYTDLTYL